MESLKRCQKCNDKRIVIVNGFWKVYGCFYPPCRGEWVAEIKKCPKETERRDKTDSRVAPAALLGMTDGKEGDGNGQAGEPVPG